MKYSNFKITGVTGKSPNDWQFKATVDVKAGLFRNKTKTIWIAKNFIGYWFFSYSGKFCPVEIENLARAYEVKHGKDLQGIAVEYSKAASSPP